jgi:hypothetical protein
MGPIIQFFGRLGQWIKEGFGLVVDLLIAVIQWGLSQANGLLTARFRVDASLEIILVVILLILVGWLIVWFFRGFWRWARYLVEWIAWFLAALVGALAGFAGVCFVVGLILIILKALLRA